MKWIRSFIILAAILGIAQARGMDLSGAWRFQLDHEDRGVDEAWFNQRLNESLTLPGVLTAQGLGEPVSMDTQWTGDVRDLWFKDPYYKQFQDPNDFKMPFWLQPERHYVGAVWYQRDIVIPDDWAGKRVVLFLERPHWETTVWLDDRHIGSRRYLSVPHEYELSVGLAPGKHRLTIRVDNRMIVNVGPNSHSVSDHTQGNWNGIVGRIELNTTDPVWIEEVRVFPLISQRQVSVEVSVNNQLESIDQLTLATHLNSETVPGQRTLSLSRSTQQQGFQSSFTQTYELDSRDLTWDEFSPTLMHLDVSLQAKVGSHTFTDTRQVRFGLREVGVQGTQITINDRPIFLRGTLECCIFPSTSHPPTDVSAWKRIVNICKDYGLNHMRFHSWCPPEAAFVAADELGFYVQVECSSWANQGTSLGDGHPIDAWLYEEAAAILKAYGNHPSFIMMAYGNEPGGKQQKDYLSKFVTHWQQRDSRRLYTSGAGWPLIPESDFHSSPDPRIQAWGAGLNSIINSQAPRSNYDWSAFVQSHQDAPTVSHEIGQWCVYPNLDERRKYTGLLKARNFDIFAEQLQRHGMIHQARDFLLASGKLQALCYKADIEAALRTPGFGGFQLLDLHDFPGQGTALVGVLDPFWDEKGYITAAEYKRFSGPIVPLARLPRRIFETGDTLDVSVQLAQFGPVDLQAVQPAWTLRDIDDQIVKNGVFARQDIATGHLADIGRVHTVLNGFTQAIQLTLEVTLPETEVVNHWDIWVYPKQGISTSQDVLITRELDVDAQQRLIQGGKVLWLPSSHSIKDDPQHPIRMGFSSIFWNTVWTDWQPSHTLGILCDPQHAALRDFPTEFHSNWQWWDLVHDSQPFILTKYQDLQPIVQVIDDWVTARKLALIFEAQVGAGSLMACSSDLVSDLQRRPVARQMRASILEYMASDDFQPQTALTLEQLLALYREPTVLERYKLKALAEVNGNPYASAAEIDVVIK